MEPSPMPDRPNPIRETDDEARALALRLIEGARIAALAVADPATGAPYVSRIAVGLVGGAGLAALVSALSLHTRALRADPRACLLLGEPSGKGDPLAQPRLSLSATARFVPPGDPEDARLRAAWTALHPKSRLYLGLPDFAFVLFTPVSAALNGGFARAFALAASDLKLS